MPRFRLYWNIWLKTAQYALMETLVNRGTSALFLLGKAMRFGVTLLFVMTVMTATPTFAGYTTSQMLVFFLVYQFLDTVSQIFLRGVYFFSWQIRSGELDFYLLKPISPLFRILAGKPDLLDAIFFLPTTALSIWLAAPIIGTLSVTQMLSATLLMINGLAIALSFHILVVCLGVLTTEVDNAIMLFRDVNNMGRFPINVYSEPLRTILFFIVPIGIMNTLPAQVLLNTTPTTSLLFGCLIGLFSLLGCGVLWSWSIKRYTGAGG